ncbi:MAG TPA: methyltransferase domain-containing protein [Burkholderiaceae bacterium]|nr:methyltransferase domain-containing protein [Burkholderiaceae bacterium]
MQRRPSSAGTDARAGPHAAALAQYRRRAAVYDLELAAFEPIRRRAIEALAPQPGDVVLDVGCGTGLSFAALRAAVGSEGRVIGIEQSAEMVAQARERVRANGWSNVTLIEATTSEAPIGLAADAALLHFTHDILREPPALAHLMRHLRPGARVTAAGLQWAGAVLWPINLFVLGAALHSVSSLEGLDRPWSRLAALTERHRVDALLGGSVFVFSAVVPAHA